MFFFVYLLKSEQSGEFYIGFTQNLKKRLKEHANGENQSTKYARPWKLLYFEGCLNQKDALRREKYLKTSQGSRLLKTRIKEYIYDSRHS